MLSLFQERTSIRRFKEKKVEKEKLEGLLQAALWSPSSKSRRPWYFQVVQEPELLQALSGCKPHGATFLALAPLAIVVAADPKVCDIWIEDASIAATMIQIAAQKLGLGSCWIQVRGRFHENGEMASSYILDALKMPNNLEVLCILAIGYPDESNRTKTLAAFPHAKVGGYLPEKE